VETQVNVGEDDLWAEKDKDASRTYSFDLTGLMQEGDSVTSAAWAVSSPTGASPVTIAASSLSGNKAKVTAAGGTQRQWYGLVCTYSTALGDTNQFTMMLFVKEDSEASMVMGSALFPNKFAAVAAMKRDRLFGVARSALPGINPSTEYIWAKLLAAESEMAHTLRVELQPTRFFSMEPTQAQIDALGTMPWKVDPAYDYEPAMFVGEKWGWLVLRNKPVISVIGMSVNYPQQDKSILDIPADWIRIDKKYGQINLVPSSPVVSANFATTLLGGLIGANRIPFSLHVNYTAGLANAARDYPELVDAVIKTATLKIMEDAFLPQSGSISADGLSQSLSRDTAKYHETVDAIINGPKGSNGGLMTAIHGIRLGVC
jgi:hypothetical protein